MSPEQEAVLFHYELGQAASYWAYVELDLRHLAAAAVMRDARHALSVGFISIENFRSKLAFCDNILNEQFHASPHFSRWPSLCKRVQAASVVRNRLAHWTVMVYGQSKPGRRYALMNWNAEQFVAPAKARPFRPGVAPPSDALCVRELVAAKHEFEALMHALRNLRSAFLGEPERDKELEAPAPAPTASALWKRLNKSMQTTV